MSKKASSDVGSYRNSSSKALKARDGGGVNVVPVTTTTSMSSNPWATLKKRQFSSALQLLVEDDVALENALKYFSSSCPEEGRAMPLISALRLIDDRVVHARQLKTKERVAQAKQEAHCPDKHTLEEINRQLALVASLVASKQAAK